MTKKEFIRRVHLMKLPIMEFKSDKSCAFINCFCLVWDGDNWRNKFIPQRAQLSWAEYVGEKIYQYNYREEKMKLKLKKWLRDACGSHCMIRE